MLISRQYQPRGAFDPAGGGPAWSPSDLGADLVAWYDASNAGSLTLSGADVTAWADLSGNGYTLSSTAGTNYPQYSATGFNGHPGVTFGGSGNKGLKTGSDVVALGGTIVSMFSAAQPDFTGMSNYARFVHVTRNAFTDYDNAESGILYMRDNNTASCGGVRNSSAVLSPQTLVDDTPYRLAGIYDGTNYTSYVNNAAGSSDSSSGTFTSSLIIYIGRGTGGEMWGGPVAEVIIAKSAPDATLRQTIDDYLTAKWGL